MNMVITNTKHLVSILKKFSALENALYNLVLMFWYPSCFMKKGGKHFLYNCNIHLEGKKCLLCKSKQTYFHSVASLCFSCKCSQLIKLILFHIAVLISSSSMPLSSSFCLLLPLPSEPVHLTHLFGNWRFSATLVCEGKGILNVTSSSRTCYSCFFLWHMLWRWEEFE